jgi:hypothetical protein
MRDSEAIAVKVGGDGAAPDSLTVADALIAAYAAFQPPSAAHTVVDYQLTLRGTPLASTVPLKDICEQVTRMAPPLTDSAASGSPVRGGMSPLDPLARASLARRSLLVFELTLRPEAYIPPSLHKQLLGGNQERQFSPKRSLGKSEGTGSGAPMSSLSAVISLMLGGRKLAMDATTPVDAQQPSPKRSSGGCALSSSSPRPVIVELRSCLFRERWGTDLCATCNTHRRFHATFAPSVAEVQKRIVEQSALSPSRRGVPSSKLRKSAPWSWTADATSHSGSSGAASPQGEEGDVATMSRCSLSGCSSAKACHAFKAPWNGPDCCERCHCNAAAHTKRPETAVSGKRAKTGNDVSSSSWREVRAVCSTFQPHWNNNSVCEHCYRSISLHTDPGARRWRRADPSLRKAAKGVAKEGVDGSTRHLFFSALPWHAILPYCPVESLFRCACASRVLTLAARPLLAATMRAVRDYSAVHLKQELAKSSFDIAQQLSHASDVTASIIRVIRVLLRQQQSAGPDSFAALVDMVHQLSAVNALSTPEDAATLVASLPVPLQKEQPELYHVVSYAKAVVTEAMVKRRAAAYLEQKLITL